MAQSTTPTAVSTSFEALKQTNEHGAEYWSARDLQTMLGYTQWRRFEQAIERAKLSCESSGNRPDYHFAGAGKMIEVGKGGQREVPDYHLSRFACYLIAQNGDPRKAEIAQAQKYFAVQTRRRELDEQAAADLERLELRKQTAEEFKALSGAANQFRMTQTRDKLARENINSQAQAIHTHEQVGREVRTAIERIGGTLPEKIPPAEHIKTVEKRLKTVTPRLELDDHEASALLGNTEKK